MITFNCFKKCLCQKRLLKLMKRENEEVQKYCSQRDWGKAQLWLDKNKITFKAFRKILYL